MIIIIIILIIMIAILTILTILTLVIIIIITKIIIITERKKLILEGFQISSSGFLQAKLRAVSGFGFGVLELRPLNGLEFRVQWGLGIRV